MSQRNEREELARSVMELIDGGHRRISRYLDLTRVRVLRLVIDRGPVRPSAIAADLGMTASAVSRHLTALERAGQVATEPDPADARTFLVRAAEAGRRELEVTTAAGARVFAEVVADWPEADVRAARDLVDRLNLAWSRRGESRTRAGAGPRWRRAHTAAGEGGER